MISLWLPTPKSHRHDSANANSSRSSPASKCCDCHQRGLLDSHVLGLCGFTDLPETVNDDTIDDDDIPLSILKMLLKLVECLLSGMASLDENLATDVSKEVNWD